MAGFLKNRSGTAFDGSGASKQTPSLGPVGTSGLNPDLQKQIGMGSPGYTKQVGSVLGGAADLSGLGCADPADHQRADNHTRSPMSQTYFKRSAV